MKLVSQLFKTLGGYPYGFKCVFRYPTEILMKTKRCFRRSGFDCAVYGFMIPDGAKVVTKDF